MPKISVTSSKQNKLNTELDRDDKILKLLESINKNILASNKREETTQKIINELVRQGLKGSTAKSLSDEQARKQKAQADAAELRAKRIDESIRLQNEKAQRLADKEIANAKAALERQKQAELRTATADLTLKKMQLQYKQDIEELQKKSKEAYKDTTLYKAGSNIAGQKSNALSSMAVSAMTGGILSPVIVKTLGLDKPLTAFTNMIGRGIGNLFGSKKKNKELETYDKKLNSLKKGKDKEEDDNYSSVAKEKDSTGLLARTLLSLKDWLTGNKKEKVKEKSDEKTFLEKLISGVKAVFGLASGIASLIWLTKNWKEVKDTLTKSWKIFSGITNTIYNIGKAINIFSQAIGMAIGDMQTDFLKAKDFIVDLFTGKTIKDAWTKLKYNNIQKKAEKEILEKNIPLDEMTTAQRRVYLNKQRTQVPREILYAPEPGIHQPENDAPANIGIADMVGQRVPLNYNFYSGNENKIPFDIMNNVEAVRGNLVDPLQKALDEKYGPGQRKVIITSSYRNSRYNQRVGGARNSRHLTGKAIDLQVTGMSPEEVIMFMQDNNIPFDRAIAETSGSTKWLHAEYDRAGTHAGVVAKMNARTKQYSVINPGKQQSQISSVGKATDNNMSWKSENINTPEENLFNNVSNSNALLNGILDATSANDGFAEPAQTSQNQTPTQIFNITQAGSSKDDSIYAFGDVAKSIILSTM